MKKRCLQDCPVLNDSLLLERLEKIENRISNNEADLAWGNIISMAIGIIAGLLWTGKIMLGR